MAELFSETSKQFGLAVGLLVVAVVVLARWGYKLNQDLRMRTDQEMTKLEARIKELEIERDLYRDRWLEALGTAEVGKEATRRLTAKPRR